MKNLKLEIIFLVVLNISLFAQEPVSFRNISLGGVIYDNLDLIYDPIELRFVDSLRIFTNLSNLTSTREQILNNYSDNELLVGLSRANPFVKNLWNSVLIRWQDFEYANPVWIDPGFLLQREYGDGVLEDDFTHFVDTGGDGLYDIKRNVYQKKSNLSNNNNYSVVLNNSYLMDDLTFGLKLIYGRRNAESTFSSVPMGTGRYNLLGVLVPSPEFSTRVDEFLIDSNYSALKWSENGTFKNHFQKPLFDLAASAMMPFQKLELRGDLFFSSIDEEDVRDYYYEGKVEDFKPYIEAYKEFYSENQRYISNQIMDGIGFGIGASVKHVFNKGISRIYDGYWAAGIRYGLQTFDYERSTSNNFNSSQDIFDGEGGNSDLLESYINKIVFSELGDGSRNNIILNGRFNILLMNDVQFGCGVSYGSSWLSRDTKMHYAYNSIQNHTVVDTFMNTEDFITTTSENLEGNRRYEENITVLTIPVGIEYLFTEDQRWALRVGSIFNYISFEERESLQITDAKPFTTFTEFGDGTVTVNYDENRYSSTGLKKPEAVSSTLFTYGLGFKATENLQIDMIGFFDVEDDISLLQFFKYLRFSFSLKI